MAVSKGVIKVVADVVILILVIIATVLLYILGEPAKLGFTCGDQTLMYNFKPSTISSAGLFAGCLIIPIVVITIIEYFNNRKLENYLVKREKFKKLAQTLYRYVGIFIFGFAVSNLIAMVCKYTFGGLRPHFRDICKAEVEYSCRNEYDFIEKYECKIDPSEKNLLLESRLSFFSAHATLSTFAAFYLIFFVQYRLCFPTSLLLKPFLQVLFFALALLTMLTRLSDFKHHWYDLLAGFIVGVVLAFFFAFWMAHVRLSEVPCLNVDEIRKRDVQMREYHEKHQEFHHHEKPISLTNS